MRRIGLAVSLTLSLTLAPLGHGDAGGEEGPSNWLVDE
jgi:hypothetical protein